MSREPPIVPAGDVRGFFRERLTDVISRRGLRIEPETEFYVVNLLAEFSDAEQLYDLGEDGRRDSQPLALLLARALVRPS